MRAVLLTSRMTQQGRVRGEHMSGGQRAQGGLASGVGPGEVEDCVCMAPGLEPELPQRQPGTHSAL